MSAGNATPRPWTKIQGRFGGMWVVMASDHRHPALPDFPAGGESEANADLIVAAVNAWDDAEALRRRLHELDSVDAPDSPEDDIEYARRHA